MPIVRRSNRTQWVSIDLGTLNQIKNSDALAVWVFLLAKPDDWIVKTKHVQQKLGIGCDRMRKAVSQLTELGLWKSTHIRCPVTGKLEGRVITVYEEPHNRTIGNPYVRITEASETTSIPNNKDSNPQRNKKVKVKKADPQVNTVRLNFSTYFGLELPTNVKSLIDEARLCSILKKEGVTDTDHVRRVVGEWAGMAERGFKSDSISALIYFCRLKNIHSTKEGDENLPKFI